jgi:hypothetical protein
MSEEQTIYCVNHPQTETTLRCNRCNDPICTRCAVRTPTGYRCINCVRGQQKAFETTEWYDFPLAMLIAGGLSFLGSMIVPRLSFFTVFLAPIAGTIIAEVVRMVLQRRRSPRLFRLTAVATAAGSLPMLLLYLGNTISAISGSGGLFSLLPLVWQALYAFMVTSTMYYRLAGIQIRR